MSQMIVSITGSAGILIRSTDGTSEDVLISECQVDFPSNYGVEVLAENHLLQDVTFERCKFVDTNGSGVRLHAAGGNLEAVTFDRCSFTANWHSGLALSASDATLSGVTVRECFFSKQRTDGITASAGIDGPIEGLTIDRCEIHHSLRHGIAISADSAHVMGCRITDCHLVNNDDDGIRVTGDKARSFLIDGNTLSKSNVSGTGILLTESTFQNYVFRNVCMNYGSGFDLSVAVTRGPIVSDFGGLAATGNPSHPMANFAR